MPFFDGTATLTNRNTFLDVDVQWCEEEQAHRRSHSTPPRAKFEEEDLEPDAKPFARLLSDCTTSDCTTASTEYRDFDCTFDRQTTQQSSASDGVQTGTQNSPASSFNTAVEEPRLETLHTVMIKNIPCRCRTTEVLRAVDSLGFAGSYDFFYLPTNRRNRQGVGYAFINFIEVGTAARFKDAIWGYRFPGRKSTKKVEVAAAELQGRAEIEAHFSGTHVVNTCYGPFV